MFCEVSGPQVEHNKTRCQLFCKIQYAAIEGTSRGPAVNTSTVTAGSVAAAEKTVAIKGTAGGTAPTAGTAATGDTVVAGVAATASTVAAEGRAMKYQHNCQRLTKYITSYFIRLN